MRLEFHRGILGHGKPIQTSSMRLVFGYLDLHVWDYLRHITIPKCHLETQVNLPYRTIWHHEGLKSFDVRTLVFPKLCNSETLKIPKVTYEILGPQRLWAHRPTGPHDVGPPGPRGPF